MVNSNFSNQSNIFQINKIYEQPLPLTNENKTKKLSTLFSTSIETKTYPAFAAVANLVPERFPNLRTISRVAMAILFPLTLIATGVTAIAKSFQGGETKQEEVLLTPNPLYVESENVYAQQNPGPVYEKVDIEPNYDSMLNFQLNKEKSRGEGSVNRIVNPLYVESENVYAQQNPGPVYEKVDIEPNYDSMVNFLQSNQEKSRGEGNVTQQPSVYSIPQDSLQDPLQDSPQDSRQITSKSGILSIDTKSEKSFLNDFKNKPVGFATHIHFTQNGKTVDRIYVKTPESKIPGYTYYNVTKNTNNNTFKVTPHTYGNCASKTYSSDQFDNLANAIYKMQQHNQSKVKTYQSLVSIGEKGEVPFTYSLPDPDSSYIKPSG